jgi:hypothetical protein
VKLVSVIERVRVVAAHEAISWLVTWFAERCKRDKNSIKTVPMHFSGEICEEERFVHEERKRERTVTCTFAPATH